MKYLVGLIGENGAGKDTFTTFFRAAALRLRSLRYDSGQAALSVSRVRFSDILYETLRIWGIEATRSTLQNTAIIMDRQFGRGSVTQATEARIKRQKGDIVIVEGVRWKQDVPMLRSFANSILVYVTAPPAVRFERMQKREETGGKKLTREQFEKEEKALTELDIPEIGKSADFKIENNGSLDEFRKKVEQFCSNLKLKT